MRIGFLAPEGTFTWETAQIVAQQQRWLPDAEFVAYPSGEDVIAAVDHGDVDHGVVAVATSLTGEVPRVRELVFSSQNVEVVDEHQRVCHYTLMAKSGASLATIRTVCSVKKALDDSADWLRTHLPGAELHYTPSTGVGANQVGSADDPTLAAVAPGSAAARYDLVALAENIEDDPQNWTRWLVLAHSQRAG